VLSVVRVRDWENPILQIKFRKLSHLILNLDHAIKFAAGHEST